MKRCSKCKVDKPFNEFRRNRSMRDGYQHYCKLCQRAYDARYRRSERGQQKDKEYRKRYHARNRDIANKRCRESYYKFREKRIEKSKRWIANNRDKFNAWAREYGKRPEIRAKFYARMHKNRAKAAGDNFDRFQWARVIALQGGCCAWCGAKTRLAVDHIVPITRKDTSNAIFNIQGLCASCNGAKGDKMLGTFIFPRPLLSRLEIA